MSTGQPMMCSTCKLDYTTWGQYEEHFWSMIHHKQLEMQYGSGMMHVCSLCNAKTESLSSYAKHLVSDVHLRAMEERKKSRQLQIQIQKQHAQRNHLAMMGPRYSQTYQGGWMRGVWEQNQRKIWPRYYDRNRYSNSSQNRMWSAKSDFEAPPKKVTSPHSSSMKSSSRSSLLKSSASSSGGIKPGSYQLKTPCSVKQPSKAGADKGTSKTRITKSSIDVKGLSSEVKPSSKQNTKEKTLRTTIKATSRMVVKSKTDHSTEKSSVPKLSSHVTSSTLKGTRLSLSFKTSTLSTNCRSCGKGDQDKNEKNRNGSSESEKNLKYQNCEPSTSTPAISESTGEKLSASGLKCSKSEDKQEQEESTKQKKRTSSVGKTIEASVDDGSGNRMNINSQSDVIKRGTELGTDFDLKKARRMDMSQMPDRIGKTSAAGEIRASMEKREKMLYLSEETVVKEVNLTSDGTPKTNLRGDEERVSIQSAQPTASTIRASSVSKTSGKSSDLNSMALPSSSVDGKSQNTLAIGKTPPEVSRLNLPQSNPDLGEKDPMSGVMPSVASSEDPLESIELSGEASVTRVQLPPSLQRELTKLLVKSQEPRPRPNLAAARSRLHAGEHHQAQVVESPDRMVQKLLMKLLDSPKSRDRQVQQIEELQRLLVQASKKGSERARFGVQQLPEISLDVLESLLKSGQLKPLLSEDGMKLDKNHPVTLHLTELADSKEQLRRPFLVNSPVNKPHPESGTSIVIKQEKIESETRIKTEPSSPVPNEITIKSEPNLDSAVSTDVASSLQTMPSPLQAPSLTIQLQGGSGPNKIIKITDVRSLSCTSQSIDPKEVGNLTTEADQQQPALPKEPSKVSEKTPRKRRTSPLDLKDILLELSLKEERFHKRLITVESSLRTTKELISKKQKHVRKLKEQRSKISQDVTAIRTKRLQLLKEATTSSLLSPGSQKSLTKACQKKCQKLTSQASCRRSSSGSTPISGLLSSLTARSSNSCPVTNPRKIHATSVACTKSYPVTKLSFKRSSIQGKSQGPAGRTKCQGAMCSTKVVSGAEAGSKLPQRFATGSSLQNPVEFHTRNTESSLSRSVNNLYNIPTTEACTNRYFANSAPTYKVSFRESSLQGKSQGPAGRTKCQGAMCSTEVVSGAKPGSKLPQSFATGSSLQNPVKFQTRTTESTLSRPVDNLYSIPTTTEACTNRYFANSVPTNNVSFRGSSLQGKSQGPAGRTIFQGAMCSTEVVSGAKPGSKLPQSFAAGSSLQNPVKFQTRTTESSLSRPVDNLHNIQTTTKACTNSYSANSAATNNVSFRGSSLQSKSQGPAGRTIFQGAMCSTEVVSGAKPGSKLPQSFATGSSLQNPVKFQTRTTVSSLSRPVDNLHNIPTTTEACTNSYSANSAATNVSFRGSSLQSKSQGPAGRTIFQGVMCTTEVVSGAKPGSKLPQSFATGSSLQNPVEFQTRSTESSLSRPVDNLHNIQTTIEACTNSYSANSAPTNNVSFRGSSLQDKSQGPAGRTLFQGSMSSTPVSASGSSPGSGPLLSSTTGSFLKILANTTLKIRAEATIAGSVKKGNTTSDSVDKPQQVKVKVEPVDKVKVEPVDKVKVERIDPESSLSCPVNTPFKIQATSVACTNPCPVTHSTPTNQISFRGSSIQGKSQGPAGRTIFQGPVSSTPVSISGSSPSYSSTGSSLIPFNIYAEATTAGSAKKSNTTSGSVDKPQQVKIKVEPIDPGYQDVGIASLHAALVPLPETSLCEQARRAPSSLFGTSTSSNTLLETGVQGQSRGKKQIIGDISNTEKTNQGHQMTPRSKKRLCLSVSASPLSKKARTTEGLKEVLAKAKSSRSEVGHPTRSAVSSDTATQEVPSAHKKSPQSTFVCEKWMPELKLRKIELQDTTSIIKMEKWLSVTTEEGKGSSKGSSKETLDFSVFEISSDSESSAPEEPTTSGVKSSSRIKSKLSAFKTYSSSPQSAYEQQGTPEAKCGLFKAHCKAVHGLCSVKGRLCTVSADSTAKVFNIKDFSCHKSFTSHKSSVNCAAAWSHRDTDYLFTGSSDEIVRVYNMQTFSCEKVICCNSRVMCLLLRWETLYAGLANGFVTVINLQDFTTETLRCKRDILIECMITASYRGEACLVIAYSDNTVGVHALGDGKQHMYLKGHTGPVLCLGVLDHHVYSGSVDRKVIIHDLKTGIRTKTIKHHGSAVTALIVGTPYLITASLDKKVRLFSAQNGKLGRVIAECPSMITCMIRIKKMLYVGYTTGYVEAIDVKPNSKRNVSVTKKPKKMMFNCEWFECGVPVNVSNSTKHLNDYHIIRKKEHQCKWGFCDVVIDKALPNCQELLWEHVKAHIQPKA